MKFYLMDTNSLISFVTDRNIAQQEVVAPLFVAASRQKCTLICHQYVLTEFIFVLDKVYQVPKTTINAMVRDLVSMPGVEVRHETDINRMLALWPERLADLGDALVATAAKAIKGAVIVTFDAKFKVALKVLGLPVYQA